MRLTVRLWQQDTQDGITGAKAVTAFYSLRRNKDIHFFIGPSWTPGLLALAPIVSRDIEVVMMTHDGGVKEFHLAGKNLFNSRGVDESSTRELAKLAYQIGARTAAIFGSQQAWELDQGRFFEEEFTKSGGTIVAKVEPIPTMGDLNAEALKVISKKPDVILFSAYTQLDLALKALGSLNYKGKKIMAFIDDSRIRLAGSAIEGGITYESLNLSNTFTDRLKKAYPTTEPFWTAYTGYDSVMAYAKAITTAKSFDPQTVAQALTGVSLDDAVSGAFSFDGERLAIRKATNYVIVQSGELVPYRPEANNELNVVHQH
jgi:ABC-type branched-subunit amino acid transport system substrate-binding protein